MTGPTEARDLAERLIRPGLEVYGPGPRGIFVQWKEGDPDADQRLRDAFALAKLWGFV